MTAVCPHETPVLTSPVVETDDDAELVRRARLRDQQAFARLYRRHIGRVHALCRRMTGDLLALAFYPGMPPRRTDSAA